MVKQSKSGKSRKSVNSGKSGKSRKSISSYNSLNNTLRNLDMTDALLILIVLLVICYMLMNTGDGGSSNNNNNNNNNNGNGNNTAELAPFKQGFQNNINSNSNKDVLMLFHADWCGHCKTFMPIWDEATTYYNKNPHKLSNGNTLKLEKVESTDSATMKKYKIKGYPTVKFITSK